MKKGIIAISLLLSGALLITPIANAINTKNESQPIKIEQVTTNENVESSNQTNDKTTQNDKTAQTEEVKDSEKETQTVVKEEITKQPVNEEVKKEETTQPSNESVVNEDKEVSESGMSKAEAEAVLNKYLTEVEKVDFTYTYQGDENNFEAMKEKGIRGYVFLPNIETDMAYLVDKDNGTIYFFHPSGYFQVLN